MISLLGTWMPHGIDLMLRAAWEAGVVMTGLSAGSLCWFDARRDRVPRREPAVRGHGLPPLLQRRPLRRQAGAPGGVPQRAIADGMPAGYGTGDGAALHFVGTELAEVVASRPKARAYHVTRDEVTETELATRFLGAPLAVEPALAA